MKRMIVRIEYPWAGTTPDETSFDIDNDLTQEELEAIANETANELVWDRCSCTWEVIYGGDQA